MEMDDSKGIHLGVPWAPGPCSIPDFARHDFHFLAKI